MRSRGTATCSAGMYCVPCAAGAPGAAATGAGGGGGGVGRARELAAGAEAAGAAADCPAITASMSSLVMRPPAPVPSSVVRSMLCSLASRRTSGEECTRSVVLAAAPSACGTAVEAAAGAGVGAALGAGVAPGFAAAGGAAAGAGAEATAAPAPSITATTVWIGTVWPSGILISFSTPAEGEGISASTLSVEISNSGSSRSTLSPGFFSHLVMVPSKMLSPIWGITTSTGIAVISLLSQKKLPTGALLACEQPNRSSLQGKQREQKGLSPS